MDTEVRIERVLPATIGQVYDAWTRAELLTRWYCPNPAWELKVSADVRVGGDYVVEMGPHVVRGTYLEVEPPTRLAFSWKWDGTDDEPTRVEVALSEVADGTHMLLTHTDFTTAEDATNHRLGWEPELTRLADLLTTQHPTPTEPEKVEPRAVTRGSGGRMDRWLTQLPDLRRNWRFCLSLCASPTPSRRVPDPGCAL